MASRGHGRSSFDNITISYALMAWNVPALRDHLSIARVSFVGWSDGGISGFELALTHPERRPKVVASGAKYDWTGIRAAAAAPTAMSRLPSAPASPPDDQAIAPHPPRWRACSAAISHLWQREPAAIPAQLRTTISPRLSRDGEPAESINLDQVRELAELIPNAELAQRHGTGHRAQPGQPAELNWIMLDDLAQ